jgi:cobalamin biosynthesis Mg chelatase CobN
VSVNGVEEDGVDNRVEAPTWAPDEGSDSTAPDEQPDGISTTTPESPASASRPETPAASATKSTTASASDSVSDAPAAVRQPASNSANASAGSGSPQAGSLMTPPAPATRPAQTAPLPSAVGTAAGAARGLAAKVSAPFSGLTKSKPKSQMAPRPQTQPRPVRTPADGGLAARPQTGVRPTARVTPGQPVGPQARRAQLRLDRVEPWSVMKFSFLISLVGWIVLVIAVSVLYFVLSKLGVFTSIEHTVGLVTTSKSKPGSDAAGWFKASRILGYTMLVGAINVVLMTALATIGAVLYNLVTLLAGGIEVTLRESD